MNSTVGRLDTTDQVSPQILLLVKFSIWTYGIMGIMVLSKLPTKTFCEAMLLAFNNFSVLIGIVELVQYRDYCIVQYILNH